MADNNKKLTIFQRLNRITTPDGIEPKVLSNKYSIGDKEILKTNSKEDFNVAKLQAQQSKYLSHMWGRVDNELFQQSIQYEMTRIGAYSDFENMEFYPEIAATLDIFMEESTTINNKGRVLNIYSDSKRVKSILEDLMYNRLDVHTSLPMWVRNTCKYGDNFVYLNINETRGIVGAKQMPNFEMERREGGVYDSISAAYSNSGRDASIDDRTKFYWRGRDMEFQSWQIAHFRLLGDDRRLPYGTSVLEKCRRIWKQLLLSEDAMLVYRVTRAPERRVFKIYVGNIDDEDVQSYVNEIANRFKRASIIDSKTGQIDLRYNQLANDQDFFIPVRDESSPNPIDTLPGASNLDQIADIEYLQRKLFTALRVPKSFLGFDEPTGDGKNLALMDIRFARTINRIQQAIIQELNKIAIIHLYILGFDDDLDNFTITMNNPSTQSLMLEVENLQQKVTLLKDAISDAGNGFGVMSMTRAKREILGWSDDEIRQDLLEQRIEKAAAAELANTANVIKNTRLFDKVDKLYGDIEKAREGGAAPEEGENGGPSGGGGGGGGFGGGGLGTSDVDFGDEAETDEEDSGIGGDVGGEAVGGEAVGGEAEVTDTGEAEVEGSDIEPAPDTEFAESLNKLKTIITESKVQNKPSISYVDKLINTLSFTKQDVEINENNIRTTDKNLKLNESIDKLLKDIDKKL